MELYIHIPFCVKKCAYCDFLSFSADEGTKRRYVEKLMEEMGQSGAVCAGTIRFRPCLWAAAPLLY